MSTPHGNSKKKSIIASTNITLVVMILFAGAIFGRITYIFTGRAEYLKERKKEIAASVKESTPLRGSIFDENRNLLVAYISKYDLEFDPTTASEKIFNTGIDSLAMGLSGFLKDKTAQEYKDLFVTMRKNKRKNVRIAQSLSYENKELLKKLPIFRLTQFKGGLIVLTRNVNIHTVDTLMNRVLGSVHFDGMTGKSVVPKYGLEFFYNNELSGVAGKSYGLEVADIGFLNEQNGTIHEEIPSADLITALNVDLQQFAHTELLKQLKRTDAKYGTVVVMEVETGLIKAMVNLGYAKGDTLKRYNERQDNYAVGKRNTPGSTFKTAIMMAALEDRYIEPTDTFYLGGRGFKYYNGKQDTIRDNSAYGYLTSKQILEKSSNIGMSEIMMKYMKKPEKLIERLNAYGFGGVSGIDLSGEDEPLITRPGSAAWNKSLFLRMGFGYQMETTPIQILTFYNAIANGGKRVTPHIVKEQVQNGKTINTWNWKKHTTRICEDKNVKIIQDMLLGVVERGTAQSIKSTDYKIAGKTGTVRFYDDLIGYKNKRYEASFVGYFPADRPKYSCIVVISDINPEVADYYGAEVAAPVFKKIADKIFYQDAELYAFKPTRGSATAPESKNGYRSDIARVLKILGVSVSANKIASDWIKTTSTRRNVSMSNLVIQTSIVPNVLDMSAKDAVFLLESIGYDVTLSGRGSIKKQMPEAGVKTKKGTTIHLTM